MAIRTTQIRRWLIVALLGVGVVFQAFADEEEAIEKKIMARFEPCMPTVDISYDVSYRFLGLNLFCVATGHVRTTEGYWRNEITGDQTRACYMDLSLQTLNLDSPPEDSRVYIDNRMLSVLTMPKLDTLCYVKKTHEYVNPIFGKKRHSHHIHIYNFENGPMDFYAHNYLTDTIETNLTGATDLAAQGQEVSRVIQLISEVYDGKKELITPDSDFRLQINIDGIATPFAVRTTRTTSALRMADIDVPALRVDVEPAKEARKIQRRDFAMWATSLAEIAQHAEDDGLLYVATVSPPWSMIPLMADYDLALGSIRCRLTDICTVDPDRKPIVLTSTQDPKQPLNVP
jgi:hypothetical protein